MDERAISASEATIKTFTVEVKVIQIDNHQMTLSVFRQLPQRGIINPSSLKLKGIPWGIVSYHTGCKKDVDHLHIVWQGDDGILYHAIEYDPVDSKRDRFFSAEKGQKYADLWDELSEQLDQLFIAV